MTVTGALRADARCMVLNHWWNSWRHLHQAGWFKEGKRTRKVDRPSRGLISCGDLHKGTISFWSQQVDIYRWIDFHDQFFPFLSGNCLVNHNDAGEMVIYRPVLYCLVWSISFGKDRVLAWNCQVLWGLQSVSGSSQFHALLLLSRAGSFLYRKRITGFWKIRSAFRHLNSSENPVMANRWRLITAS